MHDVAGVGDTIEIRGPFGGHFVWAPEDGGPLLLIGSVSGVAPLISILLHRASAAGAVPAILLYAARNWDDVIFRDELIARDAAEAEFTLLLSLSRGAARRPQDSSRRIDAEILKNTLARLQPATTARTCAQWHCHANYKPLAQLEERGVYVILTRPTTSHVNQDSLSSPAPKPHQ